jgi:hypothetical protein
MIEELSGIQSGMIDPFLRIIEEYPGQELQPWQDAVIRERRSWWMDYLERLYLSTVELLAGTSPRAEGASRQFYSQR